MLIKNVDISELQGRVCPKCLQMIGFMEWSSRSVKCRACEEKVSIRELLEPHCNPDGDPDYTEESSSLS